MQLEWDNINFKNTRECIPPTSGVYIITTDQLGFDKVIYVGKANDLARRRNEHLSPTENNDGLRKHIEKDNFMKLFFASVNNESDRDGIEAYLYDYYQPVFNYQQPQCQKPIEVNLPMDLVSIK